MVETPRSGAEPRTIGTLSGASKRLYRYLSMLFNSLSYLAFFPAAFLLYWLAPHKIRTPLLVVASYIFYMSWKPAYGILLFGLTLTNYLIGSRLESAARKKLWLALGVTVNLLTLGYFKYALFTKDLIQQLASPFGLHLPNSTLNILLPLGISFFVFEFIHYLVDVFRGNKAVRSFIDFALFASFFPTQIAGPIKRYEDFTAQTAEKKSLSVSTFDQGFSLVIQGLFKKVIIADTLAVVSQTVFPHPEFLTNLDCWLGVYAFAFQIYFDFSGYTDIARGSAKLLGFEIPVNFNAPYTAQSPTEFWHRWHISLSTWLRDYLFIPMGGSRGSAAKSYRNLMVTMLLGGLWHGAAMHFALWGAYQGALLIVHRLWCQALKGSEAWSRIRESMAYKIIATIVTFHAICIGWVLFRADDMRLANMILRKVMFLDLLEHQSSLLSISLPTLQSHLIFPYLIPTLLVLAIAHYCFSKPAWLARALAFTNSIPGRSAANSIWLAAAICALLVFSPETTPKFIYFQF